MRTRIASSLLVLALAALPSAAGAVTRPDILASFGGSFATTGSPDGGGAATSLSLLWAVGERASFGVRAFADDSGTREGRLYDPNDGTDLGSAAFAHRWSYGASWRGDVALYERDRWSSGVTADWGYWRIEDDVRGRTSGAASAVGFALGGKLTRAVGATNSMGLVVRYHRLFSNRDATPDLLDRYATAAFEWGWLASDRR